MSEQDNVDLTQLPTPELLQQIQDDLYDGLAEPVVAGTHELLRRKFTPYEALTSGLCGFGRADEVGGWSANVFLQIFDPALFGGREEFVRQSEWLANACRNVPPRLSQD